MSVCLCVCVVGFLYPAVAVRLLRALVPLHGVWLCLLIHAFTNAAGVRFTVGQTRRGLGGRALYTLVACAVRIDADMVWFLSCALGLWARFASLANQQADEQWMDGWMVVVRYSHILSCHAFYWFVGHGDMVLEGV